MADYADLERAGILCAPSTTLIGRNLLERPVSLMAGTRLISSQIGAYTSVAPGTMISHSVVGRYCSIGDGCVIVPARHPTDWLSTTSMPYQSELFNLPPAVTSEQFDVYTPAFLGHDIWIGSRAVIMGGVRVESGAVIALGAVVTKDVPPYAIVAGVPARVVRYRFPDKLIERLLAFSWWQYDLPEARKAGVSF